MIYDFNYYYINSSFYVPSITNQIHNFSLPIMKTSRKNNASTTRKMFSIFHRNLTAT